MTRVTTDYIATILAETFGSDSVRVCTSHHLQVRHNGTLHQVYVNSSGRITLHKHGHRRAKPIRGVSQLIEAIQFHNPNKTDLARAKEAVDLAQFVGYAKSALPRGVQCGVFVDAGWKHGIASIAIVEIRRGDLGLSQIAHSWPERTANSHDAELRAIHEGLEFNVLATVFSDCQPAVFQTNNQRVKWIPREQNKVADKLGNRRKA